MSAKFILAINPGSTSTKFAVFENTNPVFTKKITHQLEELQKFKRIVDQYKFRKDIILSELQQTDINLDLIRAIVGRGGVVKPIPSGVYLVNERLKQDLIKCSFGEHEIGR